MSSWNHLKWISKRHFFWNEKQHLISEARILSSGERDAPFRLGELCLSTHNPDHWWSACTTEYDKKIEYQSIVVKQKYLTSMLNTEYPPPLHGHTGSFMTLHHDITSSLGIWRATCKEQFKKQNSMLTKCFALFTFWNNSSRMTKRRNKH